LWLSNRNTRRLLAHGAHEVGASHYPLIVAVHVLWLGVLWWLAPGRAIDGFWLALFILLQLARIWVVASLGERWTTRIIILPDAPLVRRGPYHFVSHPNYIVVVGEIATLPLVFGLWWVAFLFTLLNAAALTIRIREEDTELRRLRD
jgi:methyltransferase